MATTHPFTIYIDTPSAESSSRSHTSHNNNNNLDQHRRRRRTSSASPSPAPSSTPRSHGSKQHIHRPRIGFSSPSGKSTPSSSPRFWPSPSSNNQRNPAASSGGRSNYRVHPRWRHAQVHSQLGSSGTAVGGGGGDGEHERWSRRGPATALRDTVDAASASLETTASTEDTTALHNINNKASTASPTGDPQQQQFLSRRPLRITTNILVETTIEPADCTGTDTTTTASPSPSLKPSPSTGTTATSTKTTIEVDAAPKAACITLKLPHPPNRRTNLQLVPLASSGGGTVGMPSILVEIMRQHALRERESRARLVAGLILNRVRARPLGAGRKRPGMCDAGKRTYVRSSLSVEVA